MKRLVVALVATMSMAVPAMAQAAPFPPRLNFAYDLAMEYWGREPTACSSVDKEIVPRGALGNPEIGSVSAMATQPPADAEPGSVSCILWIDRAYAEPIIFDLLCAVMIHNVGHLLGMGYSPDPDNVMNESIPIPGVCDAKGRQSTRLYFLRMKFHWLQARNGDKAEQMRRQTQRELSTEAQNFWAMGI